MEFIQRRIEDARPQNAGGRPKLLIVEDQQDARLLLQYGLREAYRTEAVAAASEALRAAQQDDYDGFLIDIELRSAENGVAVLHQLRAQDRYRQVPMIAITAHALPGDRQRFLEVGFDAYLSKPFKLEQLRNLLQRQLSASTVSSRAASSFDAHDVITC